MPIFLRLQLYQVKYKDLNPADPGASYTNNVSKADYASYKTMGGVERIDPNIGNYSPVYLEMADSLNYKNMNFDTKLIIRGNDATKLPPMIPNRLYSFEYNLQFETDDDAYFHERAKMRITIDLYPDISSSRSCTLPTVYYDVAIGTFYDLHCMEMNFELFGFTCTGNGGVMT